LDSLGVEVRREFKFFMKEVSRKLTGAQKRVFGVALQLPLLPPFLALFLLLDDGLDDGLDWSVVLAHGKVEGRMSEVQRGKKEERREEARGKKEEERSAKRGGKREWTNTLEYRNILLSRASHRKSLRSLNSVRFHPTSPSPALRFLPPRASAFPFPPVFPIFPCSFGHTLKYPTI
jgi:hypothetical protein